MFQSTNAILMIRPANFGFNEETSGDNAFQQRPLQSTKSIQEEAVREFDELVEKLRDSGVLVKVIEEKDDRGDETLSSDSVFPNNWISTHEQNCTACMYPMASIVRRLERKSSILYELEQSFVLKTIIDWSRHEKYGKYLEGTGSMVLDRRNKIAYAALSKRTNQEVFDEFCKLMQYKGIAFHATDSNGVPVYHTNVMMSVADRYAILCAKAITNSEERQFVINSLEKCGKEIVEISLEQMEKFAGNMLQVRGKDGKGILVMSTQAFTSLNTSQISQLQRYDTILHSELKTIEKYGGGSARCMLAEIFLPKKSK